MTIETSHGKARTTLPRLSDAAPTKAVRNPTEGRGPGGRFAPSNRLGINAREKHAVSKLLGPGVGDDEVMAIARDARKLFNGFLRDLPNDSQSVRDLVARRARHAAIEAYLAAKAAEAGLTTEEGEKLDDRAMKHGVRAERLAVTSYDLSTKLFAKNPTLTDAEKPFW